MLGLCGVTSEMRPCTHSNLQRGHLLPPAVLPFFHRTVLTALSPVASPSPLAPSLSPALACSKGESYVTLLNFVTGQSNAAAQGTAIALGTYHTVALLCQPDQPEGPEYAMYSCGRGFHGQLGLDSFDNREGPQRVRLCPDWHAGGSRAHQGVGWQCKTVLALKTSRGVEAGL